MTGHRFRELRMEWGYSAREIAEHFGRSTSFVYKLERYGNREIPKRWAKALCEFLGIDWEEEEKKNAKVVLEDDFDKMVDEMIKEAEEMGIDMGEETEDGYYIPPKWTREIVGEMLERKLKKK